MALGMLEDGIGKAGRWHWEGWKIALGRLEDGIGRAGTTGKNFLNSNWKVFLEDGLIQKNERTSDKTCFQGRLMQSLA